MDRSTSEEPFDVILKNRGQSFGFSIVGGTDTALDGVFIKSILPGSIAAADGQLSEGDEILKLNGFPVGGLNHSEVLDRFKRSNNEDLELTLRRRRNPISSGTITDEDQTLSRPISFPHHCKMNRDSLFDLLDKRNKESTPDDGHNMFVAKESCDVRKVVVNRLPGEPMGLEIDVKRSLGFDGPIRGVFVSHVTPGNAVDKALSPSGRIQVGDEILAINGTHLSSVGHSEVQQIISEMPLKVELLVKSKNGNDCGDNDVDKMSEVSFARPNIEKKDEEKREDSRSFIRGRKKNKPFLNTQSEVKSELKLDLQNSAITQDEVDQQDSLGGGRTDDGDDGDASDSAFYEHSKSFRGGGAETPLSTYILQTRHSSVKHENFEHRKYAFKKRRQDELGIYVEPCIIGNHRYLRVVDMSPDSFLLKHNLVERGDLLVSYNGLPLKDEAKSRFDSMLRDRGVVLEDICLEILRERNRSSDSPEDELLELERESSRRRNYDKMQGDLISTEESRTPSPTKSMRPVSRDSGMVDGGISSDGRWGWTPGTESEREDTSRGDSPRFGLYFFDETAGEASDKESVSLVNFGKLPTDNSGRSTNSKSTNPNQTLVNQRHVSAHKRNNLTKFRPVSSDLKDKNLRKSYSNTNDFEIETPPHRNAVESIRAEGEYKPVPLPRKRIPSMHNLLTRNASPEFTENVNTNISIQPKKVDAETSTELIHLPPVTSIDDEIRNEIRNEHVSPIKNEIFSVAASATDTQEKFSSLHPTSSTEINIIPQNELINLANLINSLLQNSQHLSQLPNTRVEDELFRVNIDQNIRGLGINLKMTPAGGLVQEIEKDGPAARNGNIRLGDCVLALNNMPLVTMSSTTELQNYVDSLKLSSARLIVCRNPQSIAKDLPTIDGDRDVNISAGELTRTSTKSEERQKIDQDLELEFVLSDQPTDMGLGHVSEILGVNTPYTTVIYSERKEELATLEGIQCFFKNKTFPASVSPLEDSESPPMERSASNESFDDDMLLDGMRCGFVSRVDSYKRKFKRTPKLSVAA